MNILFVCHGNICRSPMAEFVMRNLVEDSGKTQEISCFSMATHDEEVGNQPYYETVRVLRENNMKIYKHRATQIRVQDYEEYDLILCMDEENMRNLTRIFRGKDMGKVKYLLKFAPENFANPHTKQRDLIVADPYYTRNFERCYADVLRSCQGLLTQILRGNV